MSTILACTDGSQYAGSLCQHAAWVASKANAGVHVLHVIERTEAGGETNLSGNLGFDASTELLEELVSLDEAHARVARLRGKALLQDAERQLREAGISEVTTTQRHGSLVETLEEFEAQAELVVIGKRGEHADFAKGHLGEQSRASGTHGDDPDLGSLTRIQTCREGDDRIRRRHECAEGGALCL